MMSLNRKIKLALIKARNGNMITPLLHQLLIDIEEEYIRRDKKK